MIERIESNCETGEIYYFDKNGVEIKKEISESELSKSQQKQTQGNESLLTSID